LAIGVGYESELDVDELREENVTLRKQFRYPLFPESTSGNGEPVCYGATAWSPLVKSLKQVLEERESRPVKIQSITVLAGVVAIAASTVASASSLQLTFDNVSPFKFVQVNYNSGRSFDQNANGGYSNLYTGQMQWHDNAGRNLTTYCTQLTEYINWGQTVNFTITSVASVPDPTPGPMGAIRAQLVKDLYARHYFQVVASNDANLNAAFQLAIWEITHENLTAFDAAGTVAQLATGVGAIAINGGDATSAAVGGLADSMLAGLGFDGFRSIGAGLAGLTDASAQDQLIVVPLPMTAALAGLGLLGAFGIRRRLR